MAWLSGWKYRKEITVQDACVDGNLTNFPTYVPIKADADFHQARADGHDIRFTLSDALTLLKYEREHWTGGNGSPATAHFWVKVPSILASGGAIIYIYYGKRDAPDGQDAPNVWDTNFKGVWHFGEGSGMIAYDKSGQGNDGALINMEEEDWVDGKIHKALDFDGENDTVSVNPFVNGFQTDKPYSFSLLVKARDQYRPGDNYCNPAIIEIPKDNSAGWSDQTGINCHITTSDLHNLLISYVNAAGTMIYSTAYGADKKISYSQDILMHLMMMFDGTTFYLYKDGVLGFSFTPTDGVWSSPTGTYLKISFNKGGHTTRFNGLIDEVRVSNAPRAIAWNKFEHYNINEADNEITWGAEDAFPAKSSSSMRANSARRRGMRAPFIKATRPSISTIPRRGYIK